MKNHIHPAPGASAGREHAGLCRAQQQGQPGLFFALVMVSLVPLCPISCGGQVLAQGLGHLSGTLSEKSPASPPPFHQRCSGGGKCREGVGFPAGRGKLSMGLLPSILVLGSCCSAGNVPFHTVLKCCGPPGCAWVVFLPGNAFTLLGLGVSASSITSLGRARGPGGNRDSSWCFSLLQTPILDGKACGTSGWMGKLSRQ